MRFFLLLLCLSLVPFGMSEEAEKTELELKPMREWKGEAGPGVEKGPARSVILSFEEYEKLWKELGLDRSPGAIEFSTEFAVVVTSRGSGIAFRLRDEGEGKLKVMSIATRDIRPGLRYAIAVISRQGWQEVNDTKL